MADKSAAELFDIKVEVYKRQISISSQHIGKIF